VSEARADPHYPRQSLRSQNYLNARVP
jgi:hypothetical protein